MKLLKNKSFIVFLMFLFSFSLAVSGQQSLLNYIEQGDVEFRSGNYQAAIDNYTIALESFPENPKLNQKIVNAAKCKSAMESIPEFIELGFLDSARLKIAAVLGLNSFDKAAQYFNLSVNQILKNQPYGMAYVSGKQLSNGLYIGDFFMMKTEVSVQQYADFLNRSNPTKDLIIKYIDLQNNAQILFQNGKYLPTPGAEYLPVVNVSWFGAKAYAQHYGFDLPTSWEWERIAYEQSHADENFLEICWFQHNSSNRLQEVNSNACNKSLFANLYGNVWEWTDDCFQNQGFNVVGCYYHTVVGGSYRTNHHKLNQFIDYQRNETMLETIGFRCVKRLNQAAISERPSFQSQN